MGNAEGRDGCKGREASNDERQRNWCSTAGGGDRSALLQEWEERRDEMAAADEKRATMKDNETGALPQGEGIVAHCRRNGKSGGTRWLPRTRSAQR